MLQQTISLTCITWQYYIQTCYNKWYQDCSSLFSPKSSWHVLTCLWWDWSCRQDVHVLWCLVSMLTLFLRSRADFSQNPKTCCGHERAFYHHKETANINFTIFLKRNGIQLCLEGLANLTSVKAPVTLPSALGWWLGWREGSTWPGGPEHEL